MTCSFPTRLSSARSMERDQDSTVVQGRCPPPRIALLPVGHIRAPPPPALPSARPPGRMYSRNDSSPTSPFQERAMSPAPGATAAALHLWPRAYATASDIDPVAVEISAANAVANGVATGKGQEIGRAHV